MQVTGGDTNVAAYFMVRLAADGTAATGLTVTNFDLQYTRTLTAATAKSDGIVGTGGAATHVDNKVFEIDATSSPGLYLVCFVDAAFAAGVPEVILALTNPTDLAFAEAIRCQIDTPVILANNALHGGASALVTLERVVIASTTAAEPAIKATGNTTGAGLQCIGGATNGDGILTQGGNTTGQGIAAEGGSGGSGVTMLGKGTGVGLALTGGASDGTVGLIVNATATNYDAIQIIAGGTGDGIDVAAGATGDAIALAAAGGNLLEAGLIVTNSFTAGAIDAAAIATDAIGSSELATTAVNEIRDSILSDSTPFAGANIDEAISADKILADSALHGGTATVLTFDRMIGVSTSGPCVKLTGDLSGEGLECVGGSIGDGARFTGNGAGGGIAATGGVTGHALNLIGGATSGNALRAFANGTNDSAIEAIGIGTGDGMRLTGGTSGHGMGATGGGAGSGIEATGGTSDGVGIQATGGATNGVAVDLAGTGSGQGLNVTAGLTGDGASITGGATSGDALALAATTAGDPPNQLTPGVPYGTVTDAGATATSFDTDLAEAVDDFYNEGVIVFLTGNLEGSHGRITDYDGTGTVGDLTIQAGDLTAAPDNGSTFMVIGRATA